MLIYQLKSRGVRFIHGTDGTFDHLHQDQRGQAVGVVSISGKVYLADRIVLAMGASTGPNVDTKDSLRAHGYAVAKVQLDPDEARLYKNMPVLHSKSAPLPTYYSQLPTPNSHLPTPNSQLLTPT